LQEDYNENSEHCKNLIHKIINGTTLPKYALQGTRLEFRIEGISRICLAQLTRDSAIFASQGGGVHPLTQHLNIPLSLTDKPYIMERLHKAQELLEEAYILACEDEVPALEARYLGLHCQTISLTASYTPSDFIRSCYSRTSSNFCDECNLVYRLMYRALQDSIQKDVTDSLSLDLYEWLFSEDKCINDKTYKRERLYNSDFTPDANYVPELPAINDWRRSCWKKELERIYKDGTAWLTEKEMNLIEEWMAWDKNGAELPSTYDSDGVDSAKNTIKNMSYYRKVDKWTK
jgi:hypothetical protein